MLVIHGSVNLGSGDQQHQSQGWRFDTHNNPEGQVCPYFLRCNFSPDRIWSLYCACDLLTRVQICLVCSSNIKKIVGGTTQKTEIQGFGCVWPVMI